MQRCYLLRLLVRWCQWINTAWATNPIRSYSILFDESTYNYIFLYQMTDHARHNSLSMRPHVSGLPAPSPRQMMPINQYSLSHNSNQVIFNIVWWVDMITFFMYQVTDHARHNSFKECTVTINYNMIAPQAPAWSTFQLFIMLQYIKLFSYHLCVWTWTCNTAPFEKLRFAGVI